MNKPTKTRTVRISSLDDRPRSYSVSIQKDLAEHIILRGPTAGLMNAGQVVDLANALADAVDELQNAADHV